MGSFYNKISHITGLAVLALVLFVLAPLAPNAAAAPLNGMQPVGHAELGGQYSFKTVRYAMLGAVSFEPGFAALEASHGMSHLTKALDLPGVEDWPPRHSRQWWNSRSPVAPSYGLDGRLEVMTVLLRSYQLERPGLADMKEWDGIVAGLTPFSRQENQENETTFKAGRFSAKLLAARDADGPQGIMSSLSSASFSANPGRLEDPDSSQSSGYMALKVGKGPVGLTIGGGYSRTDLATSGSESPSAPKGGMSLSSLSTSNSSVNGTSSPYASVGRWSAFLAVPYQITDSLGLSPEFSYYHGDSPEYSDDAGNEWIMGLQIRFGF